MYAMIGYLPPLIHRFGVPWVDVGIYKGVTLSLASGAYMASTLIAGFLIDCIGSVNFFIACTFFQAVVMVFAAFSYNLPWVYAASLLIGLVSCNRTAAKVIGVQISDESIESKVMNYGVSVPYQIGLLLGPALGGFLVVPADQYPTFFSKGSFFDIFPTLLPNLFIGFFIATTFFLSLCSFSARKREHSESPETDELLTNYDDISNEVEDSPNNNSTTNHGEDLGDRGGFNESHGTSYLRMLRNFATSRNSLLIMPLCFICGLVGDPTLNVYSLWMYTPNDDGGMGFSPLKYAQFNCMHHLL